MRQEAERDDANQIQLLLLTAIIGVAIMVSLASLVTEMSAMPPAIIALLVATLTLAGIPILQALTRR